MGERKGTNKYYPPDYDPKAGGLNKFLGTHALRERARKIHMGIIIIRFEMPYNIWCEGCNNHIGMGVRYNAEKTKVGMYYTTPVYQFKMKCHLCDNHFVIKTDPANLDYVILSGARRQENRWDPTKNEQVVPETKEVQKRLFDDSMFKLEHGSQDHSTAESEKPRLVKLFNRNESIWSDHYTMNQKLRENFRKRKQAINMGVEKDNILCKKSSLDIPLLPEREGDKRYASLLSKLPCRTSVENNVIQRNNIICSPALPSSNLSVVKEQKALKILSASKDIGIIKRNVSKQVPRPGAVPELLGSETQTKSKDSLESNPVSYESERIGITKENNDEGLGNDSISNKSEKIEDNKESSGDVQSVSLVNSFNIKGEVIEVSKENNENVRQSISLVGDYGSSSDTEW